MAGSYPITADEVRERRFGEGRADGISETQIAAHAQRLHAARFN